MKTFEEYQTLATCVPVSLRDDRDRIQLPALALQEEAGKLGLLLAAAFASGKFCLTPDQGNEVKNRLADILWHVATLCGETRIAMQDVASHSVALLQLRARVLDPDRR